jgi:hypothetical protein
MYREEDVQGLFYPSLKSNTGPQPSSKQQQDFLLAVNNNIYYKLY